MHTDEKYIVFKRAELEARYRDIRGTDAWNEWMDMTVDDAVVIRTQDVFAAAGLQSYAQNIRGTLAALNSMTDSEGIIVVGSSDPAWLDVASLVARLEDIATYFDGVALEALDRRHRGECKLPD